MKKVSIITPCHNSEKFIHRLLDSILMQSYQAIEMITVDNDSKDNTAEIIRQYVTKFQDRGYTLTYIHQDDLGPSCAVKRALKIITGDYLIVPDSDDFFAVKDFFERMIGKLESLSDDYAIIRCQEQELQEEDLSKLGIIGEGCPSEDSGTSFEDCLLGTNHYYYPGVSYLYKVDALRATIKDMEIYGAYRIGQNRQLMLPVLYTYKCYTIQEPLVNYLVRKTSISHGDYANYSFKKEIYKNEDLYITTILNSIKQITSSDIEKYRKIYLYYSAIWMSDFALNNKYYKDALLYFLDRKRYGKTYFYQEIKFVIKLIRKALFPLNVYQ